MQNQELEQLAAIQDAEQRTREITVTERIVAKDESGRPVERAREVIVLVRPMPFRRWLTALGYITDVLAAMPQGNFDLTDSTQLALWVGELFGSVPDQVIGIACLATDQEAELFDRIDLDEGIKIVTAVIEVNKDFFVQKALPLLSSKISEVQGLSQEIVGQTA